MSDNISNQNGVKCDTIGGCDWVTANKVIAYGSLVIATLSTATAILMQQKQLDMAKKYYNMGKELHDYYVNKILPREQELIEWAFSKEQYEPQYDAASGRAVAAVNLQFKTAYDDAMRCVSRYCTGMKRYMLNDLIIQQSIARGDAHNFGYRAEEAKVEAKEDQWFIRRKEMIGLGRNLLQTSQSYSTIAGTTYGELGSAANKGASGAMQEAFRRLAPANEYQRGVVETREQPRVTPVSTIPNGNAKNPVTDPQVTTYSGQQSVGADSQTADYSWVMSRPYAAPSGSDMLYNYQQPVSPQYSGAPPASDNTQQTPMYVKVTNTTADAIGINNIGN